MFSRWWTHLLCHLHYNIPQMHFNIFHRWKGRIITRKEMREKSVLWGLRRCFQSLQCVGHFRATWQLILFYFLRCIFFMLIPFHPRWEDKYKTRVCKVKLGANTSAPRNQKLHTLLYIFWFFLRKLLSEWLRLIAAASVGVWKCARACVRSAVFTRTCVWSGWEQKRTLITRGLRPRVRRERSFHLHASRDPGGDHMPEPGQESCCVINTKSLEVPCWPGLRYRSREPQQGSLWGTDNSLPRGKDS